MAKKAWLIAAGVVLVGGVGGLAIYMYKKKNENKDAYVFTPPGTCGNDFMMSDVSMSACQAIGGEPDGESEWVYCRVGLCPANKYKGLGLSSRTTSHPAPNACIGRMTSSDCYAAGGNWNEANPTPEQLIGCHLGVGSESGEKSFKLNTPGTCPSGKKPSRLVSAGCSRSIPSEACVTSGGILDAAGNCAFDICV